MSQAKVDKYKKEKANRSKILRREKMFAFLEKGVFVLIVVAIIGWAGVSFYQYEVKENATETASTTEDSTPVNISAIYDFTSAIN